MFAADVIVIADGGNEQVGVPVLEVSTRGGVVVDVEVSTLRQPVHSGIFGGGAPDALLALVRMLSTLHDDNGDVAVAGLTAGEWSGGETDAELFRQAAGVLPGAGLVGSGRLASRLWSRPAINVIGLDAAPIAGAVNALAPRARAIVSMRIPPGVDAAEQRRLLVERLESVVPWGAQATITGDAAWPGWTTATDGPALTAARQVMADVYGAPTGLIGSGGSIPLLTTLQQLNPDAEFVLWGAEDGAQANIHSADESVDLGQLGRAALAETLCCWRGSASAADVPRAPLPAAPRARPDGPSRRTARHVGRRCPGGRPGLRREHGCGIPAGVPARFPLLRDRRARDPGRRTGGQP